MSGRLLTKNDEKFKRWMEIRTRMRRKSLPMYAKPSARRKCPYCDMETTPGALASHIKWRHE